MVGLMHGGQPPRELTTGAISQSRRSRPLLSVSPSLVELADRPDELDVIRADRPDGPLTTSYCTDRAGKRNYRYDAIWVSSHFTMGSVEYVYDEAIEAGTDHALVLAALLVGP